MNKDVFGVQGDFITSPEISQIFGEVVTLVLTISTFQMSKLSTNCLYDFRLFFTNKIVWH